MQSSAARAFSILSSKIHPQLPLTPRESQQLLSLLTSSFRRHLDREHPGIPDDLSAQSSRPAELPKNRAAQDTPLHSTSSQVPISRLLESVLANPLLAHKPARQENRPSISDLQGFAANPSQWFRDRVADGSATIHTAFLFAEAMRKTSSVAPADGTSSSKKAGAQIIQWLWASGLETTTLFIREHTFHASLAALLIQEHNERPLWRWLASDFRRALENADASPLEIAGFRGKLLKSIVLCKKNGPGELADAITAHLYACSLGQTPHNTSSPVRYSEYFSAGARIIDQIAANHTSNSIPPSLYDRFLESTQQWCNRPEVFRAMLHLHHPSRPALDPALQYLRQIADTFKVPKSSQHRIFLVNLSLTLARGLLAEEKFSDGLWVLDFVKEKFPQEVGYKSLPTDIAKEEHHSSLSKDELENLQLLETLNI